MCYTADWGLECRLLLLRHGVAIRGQFKFIDVCCEQSLRPTFFCEPKADGLSEMVTRCFTAAESLVQPDEVVALYYSSWSSTGELYISRYPI